MSIPEVLVPVPPVPVPVPVPPVPVQIGSSFRFPVGFSAFLQKPFWGWVLVSLYLDSGSNLDCRSLTVVWPLVGLGLASGQDVRPDAGRMPARCRSGCPVRIFTKNYTSLQKIILLLNDQLLGDTTFSIAPCERA